jgi:hypothetical protein
VSTSIDTARRLLRDADPLTADVEQPLLARRKSLSVPNDVVLDRPARGPAGRGSSSRRRRWLLPVAAAAAVVVVGSVAAVVHGRHDGPPTAVATSQHPAPSHHDQAVRAVTDLLALLPVLPGAVPIDQPPVTALGQPFESAGTENLIDQARLWTAPGTVEQAMAYVKAHAQPRLVVSVVESSHGGNTPAVSGVTLDPVAGYPSDAFAELSGIVTIVAYRGGVAMRADAQAVWLPERTAAQQIPAGVTAVDVVVERGTRAVTVRRTLTGEAARSLARLVNGLPTLSPGTRFCPAYHFGFTDVLTFRGVGSPIAVTAEVGGCQSVQVGGAAGPLLEAGGLDAAVLRALGLPSNYGD